MDYRLNLGAWRKVFAVPSCVAEEHLKLASGTQIKVLLYLLAYPDMGIRGEMIAGAVGASPEDVDDALLYWVQAGVLSASAGEYYPSEKEHTHVHNAQPDLAVNVPPERDSGASPEVRAALKRETHFPPSEIANAANSSSAVKYLLQEYERLAGRPLKHAEQQTLMILTEEICLPCEVTMMLVEYCFRIEKASPAYMKTVALDWVENGITDIPKAEERIMMLTNRYTAENRLRRKFGLSSAFSKKQKATIEEWADMGVSDEMIDEAYDITMNNTGKPSIPYMDKILRKWLADGITDPSALAERKKAAAHAQEMQSAMSAPSYDMTEIEQRALNKYKDL